MLEERRGGEETQRRGGEETRVAPTPDLIDNVRVEEHLEEHCRGEDRPPHLWVGSYEAGAGLLVTQRSRNREPETHSSYTHGCGIGGT